MIFSGGNDALGHRDFYGGSDASGHVGKLWRKGCSGSMRDKSIGDIDALGHIGVYLFFGGKCGYM